MDIKGRETETDNGSNSAQTSGGYTQRARCTRCEEVYRHQPDAGSVVCPYCDAIVSPEDGKPV